MMQYEHFIYGNSKDIDGSIQFIIDIYNNEKLVHSVAIMDSGARKPKAIGSYQPISENQANWLNDEVNHAPDTKASSKSDNKGLQNAYCRIKKCHKVLLSCRVCGCPKKGIKNGGQFW